MCVCVSMTFSFPICITSFVLKYQGHPHTVKFSASCQEKQEQQVVFYLKRLPAQLNKTEPTPSNSVVRHFRCNENGFSVSTFVREPGVCLPISQNECLHWAMKT